MQVPQTRTCPPQNCAQFSDKTYASYAKVNFQFPQSVGILHSIEHNLITIFLEKVFPGLMCCTEFVLFLKPMRAFC